MQTAISVKDTRLHVPEVNRAVSVKMAPFHVPTGLQKPSLTPQSLAKPDLDISINSNNDGKTIAKKPCLVMFLDYDGTFSPFSLDAMKELSEMMRNLKEKGIETKICIVSGRDPEFVRGIMHTCNSFLMLDEPPFQLGAGDQGGTLLSLHDGKKPLTEVENDPGNHVEKHVIEALKGSSFEEKVLIESGHKAICTLQVADDNHMQALEEHLKDTLEIPVTLTPSKNFLEVAPPEVSKAHAVEQMLKTIDARYEIHSIVCGGDGKNDEPMMQYVSSLSRSQANFPVHIFLPQNADTALKSLAGNKNNREIVKLSEKKYFAGILDLLQTTVKEGKLVPGLPPGNASQKNHHSPKRSTTVSTFQKDQVKPHRRRRVPYRGAFSRSHTNLLNSKEW